MNPTPPLLALDRVELRREGRAILRDVTWSIRRGERWVVLGPNGAGKTTLVRLLATYLVPSAGTATVLGERIGHVEVARLRRHIGYLSPALTALIPPVLTPRQIVGAAQVGAFMPWYLDPADLDPRRTASALEQVSMGRVADRPFGTFSSGEQLRIGLARALVTEPRALLLDEPMASLDIGGRAALLSTLSMLAAGPIEAMVLVLHRLEDIPAGFTHALLVRDGTIQAEGPMADVLRDEPMSACFGTPLRVHVEGGHWTAVAASD
jgi:iron complex transport system ATP-binding protein